MTALQFSHLRVLPVDVAQSSSRGNCDTVCTSGFVDDIIFLFDRIAACCSITAASARERANALIHAKFIICIS